MPVADGLIRLYPADAPTGAGLVWAHGGAFAAGDLDMPEADFVARSLAARGITVASVDYRLAPTPPEWAVRFGATERDGDHHPAASDDVRRAWEWMRQNARRWHVDPERLALGGASAGANLAAGAVLRLLEDGGDLPADVVLAYPTLLAVQPEPDEEVARAVAGLPDAERFDPEDIKGMYDNYLGRDSADAPLVLVPGRATVDDVRGFPPTLIIDSEADTLRISGEVFAATLRAAGRPVDLVTEPGTRHGHLNRPEEPAATRSVERIAARLNHPDRSA